GQPRSRRRLQAEEAWRALLAGPPLPLIGEKIPEQLGTIAERAMARDLYDRHAEARELAEEVHAWLEGVRRREEALRGVTGAEELLPEVRRLRAAVQRARAAADVALAEVQSYDPVEKKLPGWRLEAEAATAERRARQLELEWVLQLRGTLNLDPELPEAHGRLADFYRDRLEEAELRRDPVLAEEAEALLRVHDRGQYAAWLQGDGHLSLETQPSGAQVQLFEVVDKDRRLEPVFIENLGATPLRKILLPHGSYLLRITAPGRPMIAYPVQIERGQHWDGVAPGESHATPIQIPEKLDQDEIFVPGGWTRLGGDPDAAEGLPAQRWWIDSFVVQRYPVTNEDYCRFLNDLVDQGEDSKRWAPAGLSTDAGHYHRDAKGHYHPQTDVLGRIWSPRSPVVMISWNAAMAYAAWRAARDQKAWRLLHELEWEKAARGVDRRLQPWGTPLEPTWTNVAGSRPGPPAWTAVEDYPSDESPYGVRGMAGNVRDWCANAYSRSGAPGGGRLDPRAEAEAPLRMVRGGAWLSAAGSVRLCTRYADKPDARLSSVGFRLAR
ncbi:MAG TPA: SUMF1/EgtB/PvdO family nonheme iron enzyme, partial [Myxococcota bacterium]|nr:SUMF1/EgtB/PvdO family nonheme iron enzyme [Myxococcota bacterium]